MNLLVVDDSKAMRMIVKRTLRQAGYGDATVQEASNGKEALDALDGFDADLVLCDWNMPGINGVELLRQIRSVDPNVPFLMVTGRDDIESVVEAKASGVTAYIRKPFSSAQLEAKLRIVARKVE